MRTDNSCLMSMRKVGDVYIADGKRTYYSARYDKTLTVPDGFPSNGANVVSDKCPLGFFVHDYGCVYGLWDDGTKMSNRELSFVYHDILKENGFWGRSKIRLVGTFLGGGGAARKNGMWNI
jgi:hypothetical protein